MLRVFPKCLRSWGLYMLQRLCGYPSVLLQEYSFRGKWTSAKEASSYWTRLVCKTSASDQHIDNGTSNERYQRQRKSQKSLITQLAFKNNHIQRLGHCTITVLNELKPFCPSLSCSSWNFHPLETLSILDGYEIEVRELRNEHRYGKGKENKKKTTPTHHYLTIHSKT